MNAIAPTTERVLAPALPKRLPAIWAAAANRRKLIICMALGLLVFMCAIAIEFGTTRASWRDLLNESSPLHYIAFNIRLPRVCTGIIVGSGLALAGCLLQGLLRNPLADPGVLGVTNFAGLGAALAYLFLPMGLLLAPVAAFVCALLAASLILLFGSGKAGNGPGHLILCGIALGTTASAVLSIAMLLSRDDVMPLITWLVGSISGKSWAQLGTSGVLCTVAICFALFLGSRLNIMQLGESAARGLGLNHKATQIIIIITTSMLVASSASLAGLVGFVGLITPHVARMLCGDDYRFLLPLSAILGATLVVGGDLAARSLLAPTELPVGAVTALCGGPFFFYLILRPKKGLLCPIQH